MAITFESEKHQAAGATTEDICPILSTTFNPHPGIKISCNLDVLRQNANVVVEVLDNTVVNNETIGKDHPCVSAKFSQPTISGVASGNLDICIDDKAKVITADGSTSGETYTVHLDKYVLLHF